MIWRNPSAETEDYPGLVVHDGRVTGSITVGRSRLPLWAICSTAIKGSWNTERTWNDDVESGWEPSRYGFTEDDFAHFIYCLLEMRGEFGRLLLMLADAERRERAHDRLKDDRGWWEMPTVQRRILAQLRRCTEALEATEPKKPYSHWKSIAPGLAAYDLEHDDDLT